jgi:hypothetical protein
MIAILHNTLLATFIKLLETVSKGPFRNRSQNRCHTFLDCRREEAVLRSIHKEACADSFQKLYELCQQCVVKDDDYVEGL